MHATFRQDSAEIGRVEEGCQQSRGGTSRRFSPRWHNPKFPVNLSDDELLRIGWRILFRIDGSYGAGEGHWCSPWWSTIDPHLFHHSKRAKAAKALLIHLSNTRQKGLGALDVFVSALLAMCGAGHIPFCLLSAKVNLLLGK